MFCGEKVANQSAKKSAINFQQYIFTAVPKSLIRKEKKTKEDEQTSAELSSAHRRLQAKCRQVQTSYIKRIKFLLLAM